MQIFGFLILWLEGKKSCRNVYLKSNFDTKPTQLLQLAPKTKIFMLRWRSSSSQNAAGNQPAIAKKPVGVELQNGDENGTGPLGGSVLFYILERI